MHKFLHENYSKKFQDMPMINVEKFIAAQKLLTQLAFSDDTEWCHRVDEKYLAVTRRKSSTFIIANIVEKCLRSSCYTKNKTEIFPSDSTCILA